ncbi:MAG: SDR family NAD(P)-dependent oxidoreductase [Peptococcaceae bacterium]|nr:SDR family NAD(P)-dependent oxidoreductase [Peptococcaceae bacterium]
MKLQGKIALITGGGTGIGEAIARRFVAEGAKICIVGRRAENLQRVAESLPQGTVVTCPGSVTKPEDIERMVTKTLTIAREIDILVNNAGVSVRGIYYRS